MVGQQLCHRAELPVVHFYHDGLHRGIGTLGQILARGFPFLFQKIQMVPIGCDEREIVRNKIRMSLYVGIDRFLGQRNLSVHPLLGQTAVCSDAIYRQVLRTRIPHRQPVGSAGHLPGIVRQHTHTLYLSVRLLDVYLPLGIPRHGIQRDQRIGQNSRPDVRLPLAFLSGIRHERIAEHHALLPHGIPSPDGLFQ